MTEEIIDESVEETLKDIRKQDLDYLAKAVKHYYDISIECKRKIDNAKTKTKKQFYNKKMRKNNKIFAHLLNLYENTKKLEEDDASNAEES